MSIEIDNITAAGIAAQLRWLASVVESGTLVTGFAVAWDGDARHLRGKIQMSAGDWIRSILENQAQEEAIREAAANGPAN